jgi:hypothetical protein
MTRAVTNVAVGRICVGVEVFVSGVRVAVEGFEAVVTVGATDTDEVAHATRNDVTRHPSIVDPKTVQIIFSFTALPYLEFEIKMPKTQTRPREIVFGSRNNRCWNSSQRRSI